MNAHRLRIVRNRAVRSLRLLVEPCQRASLARAIRAGDLVVIDWSKHTFYSEPNLRPGRRCNVFVFCPTDSMRRRLRLE